MAERKGKAPEGWLKVPESVTWAVHEAVESLGPRLTGQGDDAWGSGISPRVVTMVRSLAQGDRLGPTTIEALRHMLLTANDETFTLLGGEMTREWVFAPREFDAFTDAVERLPEDATDEEIDADPTVVQARERLGAAVDKALGKVSGKTPNDPAR
jgi:hypothetical protein